MADDKRPKEKEGQLVPKADQATADAMPLVPMGENGEVVKRIKTSLDVASAEGSSLAYRCVMGEDHKAEDVVDQTFTITDWLTHDVQIPDMETGEIVPRIRTVLVTEDKQRISTVSDPLRDSLQALCAFKGKAPWKPGLRLAIRQNKSRNKRSYFILDPV